MKNLAKNRNAKQLKLVANRGAEDNSAIIKVYNKTTVHYMCSVVFVFLALFMLLWAPTNLRAEAKKVLVLPVDGEIDGGVSFFLQRQIRRAEKENIDAIILEVNSNGGLVTSAQEMKDSLLKTKVKTIAFVKGRALSAAALVTIACERIYMAPGSEMGAATPIVMVGKGVKAAEPKFVSAFRAEFASTAEARNREPKIAEAMVDPNHETIEGLCPKGDIMTLTAENAFKHGYCDQITATMSAVLRATSLENASLERATPTSTEVLVRFLTNPSISPMFLSTAIWALMIELGSPGFGVFGIVSIICFALFFGGHFFAYMAGYEILILFAIGVILILVEIFAIPGFGLTGVSGIGCIIISLINLYGGLEASFRALCALFIYSIIGLILIYKLAPKIGLFKRFILKKEMKSEEGYVAVEQNQYQHLLGLEGITLSICRPSGKVKIGDERYDVVSDGDFIEKGEHVIVKKVDGNKILVKRLEV